MNKEKPENPFVKKENKKRKKRQKRCKKNAKKLSTETVVQI